MVVIVDDPDRGISDDNLYVHEGDGLAGREALVGMAFCAFVFFCALALLAVDVFKAYPSSHPLPSDLSIKAGKTMMDIADQAEENDHDELACK